MKKMNMLKKFILSSVILIFSFKGFTFDIDEKFEVKTPNMIVKIDDQVGFLYDFKYQIKKLSDFVADPDGWYSSTICGNKLYVIFGSNYFLYHSNKDLYYPKSPSKFNFGSSFLKAKNFDEEIKTIFTLSYSEIKNPTLDDYFDEIKSIIKSVTVPDMLIEQINGNQIKYDTYDMEHYYIGDWEMGMQLFRYGARPWATSKNPVGMNIKMDFKEAQNSIVILNGYVHPDKRHLYKANRRLKKIRVTSPDANFYVESEFEDTVHFHEVKFPEPVTSVNIEILDYYEGNKYKDLCVQMFGVRNFSFLNENSIRNLSFDYLMRYKKYEE
ncbi:hypothetical protein DYE49_11745 [Treponema rectale]|uniref:NAD glycohydrolase translocation F5/8 type C domain-containing protein n=1 Tax=Treponema rectale TaxID=744512 RepID=A0A840SB76_9SPIR|nr:hypothetical protein [Treponema rectale]MBB5219007.1 hypothetical protein [Treponema rectale]QOS41081.1 hypothetical protein DYE49_11745 [Treponema rectale]